jgi:hypothetical protein
MVAEAMERTKAVVSVRPVFTAALQAWKDGRLGAELGDDAAGKLWGGFKAAGGLGSAEIGSALTEAAAAGKAMPAAAGVTWVLTSRIEGYQALFRITQGTGVGADAVSKLDSTLHYFHQHLPGYDNLESALPHGKDG